MQRQADTVTAITAAIEETALAAASSADAIGSARTCRVGVDDGAVVDKRLQVYGVDGLSVADASVMPCVTSGNTNGPVIAVANRAAAWITQRT